MPLIKPDLTSTLFDFISEENFPCVGAKTAYNKNQIAVHQFDDFTCQSHETDMLAAIHTFVDTFDIKRDMYSSLVFTFEQPDGISENEFDQALWDKLQRLHEVDACTKHWDANVSNDPHNTEFSLSLGGKGFFVVGLHPNASRKSRRFAHPSIVFNLHEQFEFLRKQQRFEALREHIRKRDTQFCGSKNDMLKNHGDSSEVYQYSGKRHAPDWECPFKCVNH
ncbi:guanitoxin biosynthesis heme-dependent pre-guanitoxin N-hydroxylase GntA [Alteromonas sp. D210916BOD_24]|uniref:guanitoxin biosynthesis heme-dependent pre-guanitoxin N-hydroxylase GntA n=1 Tax=Alteromonas sp. D210916BOD_24 TaxID=3157618 RepID=UPI00399CAD51